MSQLKSPFPWFGGKSKCAADVWDAIGEVDNYVEPFAGSLAVLLARPHPPKAETVNDLDHYIVNFWRALQHDPEQVAHYANNPVNEADLTARHIWLVNQGRERIARILGDPEYYDAKVAGWWVWGICCWIGSGWCSGNDSWSAKDGQIVKQNDGKPGVNRQLISLCRPMGVNRKRVHLSNEGRGVNRKLVHLGCTGQGVDTGEFEIFDYLNKLAERLRYVRVCCGDWTRVVTPGALAYGNTVGIFLDPPYDADLRDDVYQTDKEHGHISADVRRWCIENQDNPRYRIVLAGYEGEHDLPGWRKIEWVAGRAYGSANGVDSGNRRKERLWLSPYTQGGEICQARLF